MTDFTEPAAGSGRALRRRAAWAFWRGRAWAARLELGLALALVGGAALAAPEPRVLVVPALLLLALTATLRIHGRALGRGVLPGLLLGLLPLSCALSAARWGHVCMGGGCSSLCVPLCSAGGIVAGLLLARAARATSQPVVIWLSAGSIVLCAGAMGCMCVGASGVVGMTLGFALSAGLLAWPRTA